LSERVKTKIVHKCILITNGRAGVMSQPSNMLYFPLRRAYTMNNCMTLLRD